MGSGEGWERMGDVDLHVRTGGVHGGCVSAEEALGGGVPEERIGGDGGRRGRGRDGRHGFIFGI